MLNKFQISDLLTNFGGSNWIDREVEGTLVAMSNIVETDTMRYMKVCPPKKNNKISMYIINSKIIYEL